MAGAKDPTPHHQIRGWCLWGQPKSIVLLCSPQHTSLGLIISLSPSCLRGSTAMLSSCGYQAPAALCHLCVCAVCVASVGDGHCLAFFFIIIILSTLLISVWHNHHIVSTLRCCYASDKGTPPDLWACQQLGISCQRQFIHYLSTVKYSGRHLCNYSLNWTIKCHNGKTETHSNT